MTAKNVGGRPEHRPSLKDRRVVTRLAGLGISQNQIAAALGCARKTLAKHYHEELRDGSAKVEAELVQNLARLAGGSDATALRASIFLLRARFHWSEYMPPRPRRSARRSNSSATPRPRSTVTSIRNGRTFSYNDEAQGVAARRPPRAGLRI